MQPRLEVSVAPNGDVTIHADPVTAARLAGRSIYGAVPTTQEQLEAAIAEAWYEAGCPIAQVEEVR